MMPDTKHTPGPYTLEELAEVKVGPNLRSVYQIIGHHRAVAAVVLADQWYSQSGEANAHLFTAAPELRAELETAEPLLMLLCTVALDKKVADFLPGGDELVERVKTWIRTNRAQQVLAKAEGRA